MQALENQNQDDQYQKTHTAYNKTCDPSGQIECVVCVYLPHDLASFFGRGELPESAKAQLKLPAMAYVASGGEGGGREGASPFERVTQRQRWEEPPAEKMSTPKSVGSFFPPLGKDMRHAVQIFRDLSKFQFSDTGRSEAK